MVKTARQAAEEMLKTHWHPVDPSGFQTDPVAIARRLGINVYEVSMDNEVSGIIVREERDGEVDIFLNEAHAPVRQRFTCAHELGHYMAHLESPDPGSPFYYRRDSLSSCGWDRNEMYANGFGAALLMPAAKVRRASEDGHSSLSMAALFHVSPGAMNNRLKNLGIRV